VINVVRACHGEDVDALFAGAAVVVADKLRVERNTRVPIETRGLVAEFDPAGNLTVWGPAKVKHFNREVLADLLGMRIEQIRFIEPDVGGGFGVRGEFYPEDFLVPWLARKLGRPVKWIEDRNEHFVATNHARDQHCEIELAASADGQLLAFKAKLFINQGPTRGRTAVFCFRNSPCTTFRGPTAGPGFRSTRRACSRARRRRAPTGARRSASRRSSASG